MTTKYEVEALLDKNLTRSEIAKRLGCKTEYVTATINRNGWADRVKSVKRTAEEMAQYRRFWEETKKAQRARQAQLRRIKKATKQAAPDLLEAAKLFVTAADTAGEDDILDMLNYGAALDALRAAIAKAEGRS